MRVLLASTRGAGHIQPLLPFARALRARGVEVMVAGPAALAATLGPADLPHAVFDHPGDHALSPIWARFRGVSREEARAIAMREIFAGANARAALPKLQETIRSWRPDLVLRESSEFGSLVAAEAAGLPHARVAVHMVSFEDMIPPLVTEPLDDLLSHAASTTGALASLQKERVFCQFPASLDGESDPGLKLFPPLRLRAVKREPSSVATAWEPPDDTAPLLYITFGTLLGSSPEGRALLPLALEAAATLPVRALLTTGQDFEIGSLGNMPDNVVVAPYVPQDEVLPHVAAMICHGGSGTMLGALAAAVPMVVLPVSADQPYNAERIAAVSAGIPLFEPQVDTLRAAIERVLRDDELRAGARRMAAEMAALPTIDSAVDGLIDLARH